MLLTMATLGSLCIWMFFYMGIHIYSAVSSPLSGVPGPCRFLRYNQAQAFHKLFQRYGPVVRVGPEKIAFCDLDSMRNVYNIQRFEKSPMYSNFKMCGSLTILDNAAHAAWRKAVGSYYAATNVARMEPIIRNSTLEAIHVTEFPLILEMTILSSICNTWVWRAICLVPHKRVALFIQSVSQAICRREGPGSSAATEARRGIRVLATSSQAVNAPTFRQTKRFRLTLLAGSEPTSATLAYFLWEISHNPEALPKLRVEIDAIMPDLTVIPDLTVLQELPYLTVFIQEATGNFELMGYSLPPGTVVGTQAWSMHKDPVVFPNPECFSPQRWLDGAEPWRSLREEHLMPFGLGSRACVGQQLAHASFRIILAAIIRNFNISAGPTTTPAMLGLCADPQRLGRISFIWGVQASIYSSHRLSGSCEILAPASELQVPGTDSDTKKIPEGHPMAVNILERATTVNFNGLRTATLTLGNARRAII
ncbi:cytochrome P450 [Mycena rebaudengoi]|nr:cytochrome P450 [Mycena rebaudengoi]